MKALRKLSEKKRNGKDLYIGRLSCGSRCLFSTTSDVDVPMINWSDFPLQYNDDSGVEVENLENFIAFSFCEVALGFLIRRSTQEDGDPSSHLEEEQKQSIIAWVSNLWNGDEIYESEIEEYFGEFEIDGDPIENLRAVYQMFVEYRWQDAPINK